MLLNYFSPSTIVLLSFHILIFNFLIVKNAGAVFSAFLHPRTNNRFLRHIPSKNAFLLLECHHENRRTKSDFPLFEQKCLYRRPSYPSPFHVCSGLFFPVSYKISGENAGRKKENSIEN